MEIPAEACRPVRPSSRPPVCPFRPSARPSTRPPVCPSARPPGTAAEPVLDLVLFQVDMVRALDISFEENNVTIEAEAGASELRNVFKCQPALHRTHAAPSVRRTYETI